jgi:hypothetical protein
MENTTLLKIAIATSLFSLLIGFMAFYLSVWIDNYKFYKKNKSQWNDSFFYPIYLLGKIFGVSILISNIIPSLSSTIKVTLRVHNELLNYDVFKFISINIFVVLIAIVIINFLSSYLMKLLFNKAEMILELNSGKFGYAIVYLGLFIGFSIIMKESILLISQILIPFEMISF